MNDFFMSSSVDLLLELPVLLLLVTGMVVMMLDAFKVHAALPIVSALGIVASIVVAVPDVMMGLIGQDSLPSFAFSGMMRSGEIASMIHILLALSGLFTLFFIGDFMKRQIARVYDVYALILFALVGMDLLANANDLIMTFIGLETMSICLYIMAGMYKKDVKSNEAGLKYFLLGAFATGFFLFGISLIYGATGATNFGWMNSETGQFIEGISWPTLVASPLFYPGLGMLIIGFLFKVSAFPFHAWTPDVYTGTPTPLAGFMSTGSKMSAFISLALFAGTGINYEPDTKFQTVIIIVAILTMVFGNIVAARQRNLKRMLAYSSIAHSGYVLLAVAAGTGDGMKAVIFYMFIYTLMNIGAFGLIGMAEQKHEDVSVDNWRGFGRANGLLGVALSIFLLSLAGIPPLAGFMGKYFVFKAAIDAGLVIPAIIGVLASVVGAYYYINVIKVMYFDDKASPSVVTSKSMVPVAGLLILAILLVAFGVYPSAIQDVIGGAF